VSFCGSWYAGDALDRGPKVVGVAVDGGQGRRRRSDEGLSSEEDSAVGESCSGE
jgi:hypothetical protein